MSTEYVVQGADDVLRRLSPAQRRLRVALTYLIAMLILTSLIYAVLARLPAVRIGDGAEYYAMELAVSHEHRPFVAAPTWAAYEQIWKQGSIASLQTADQLKSVYVPLTREGETDFNHFWFYPLMASVASAPGKYLGLVDASHARFMMLHALLIAGLLLLCFRTHGFKGMLAATALIVTSPALWYVNKVHTELFTVVLTTAAVCLALKRQWAFSGLMLAMVTTQNISFVLPAIAACLFALAAYRTEDDRAPGLMDTLALVMAAIIALLHPLYYFSRYGGLTPQLINKGAEVSHLDVFSSIQYLLDPDVGLLPNWPLGVLLLVLAAHGLYRRRLPLPRPSMAAFTAIFVLAAMAAQAATTNINSGGTAGPARYGLWYLCLFYPIVALLKPLSASRLNRWIARACWFVAMVAAAIGVRDYLPNKPESYTSPSRAASLIYGHAPWLWNPSPEVFAERNAQLGERTPPGPALVLGQGCRKALFLPGTENHVALYPAGACGLTAAAGAKLIGSQFPLLPQEPTYFSVNLEDVASMKGVLSATQPAGPTELRAYLGDGWSSDEPWGVWSLGMHSSLHLRLERPAAQGAALILRANGLWHGERHAMTVSARVNGGPWQTRTMTASEPQPAVVPIRLPALPAGADVLVELRYDKPASPASLGLSQDTRELGIGLVSLEFSPHS
ncbi:hypothetical protein QSH18_11130 [Xanthomonas sp. NCPPB 2654]|uniref:hypothetical protein n=1 Tax=unclassified Xanthomonas TaxID=2643310 RepID=UPI0021DF50AA|nr:MULTISPECIES: hypothetical protein [unclassified Xanthomonas]MDL5366159.1 hypothetical protein [Xanthomonas sp. NCPPB 2654]UYC21477.1 hypothetical protein NUG20_03990 [Xanthomonas sp. CFBP 8443]